MQKGLAKKPQRKIHEIEISDYRHKNKRKNNPDAGLATYNFKEIKKVTYAYSPHLDPQLTWSGKSEHTSFEVDTISLHIHERISTQAIIKSAQRKDSWKQQHLFAEPNLSMDKSIEFYRHEMDWTNRLILGDSLLVMNSLLERELMAGQVQTIYVDPPYAIGYDSNFQPYITRRDVKDGDDASLTREPEQVRAYRDTWTLGIHSYLTYLRDRLLLCKDLLNESGSIFVQINDLNLHHVRELMDEIFTPENFCGLIVFQTASGQPSNTLASVADYLVWYAKDKKQVKFHRLYFERTREMMDSTFNWIELNDGTSRTLTGSELKGLTPIPAGRRFKAADITRKAKEDEKPEPLKFQGRTFNPPAGFQFGYEPEVMQKLAGENRLVATGERIYFKRYADDFSVTPRHNIWTDTVTSTFASDKVYVVQTNKKVVERCIIMTSDPGDLVFDPTCGSGTTAYSAEKWGRRWITCDTSRVAIALARQGLMTAGLPYYKLLSPELGIRGGFDYTTVSHATQTSIATGADAIPETLYDDPILGQDHVRVSGPFTVEAISLPSTTTSSEIQVPLEANPPSPQQEVGLDASNYVSSMIQLLQKDGVTFSGGKTLSLEELRPLATPGFIHAEGTTKAKDKSLKVGVSFGPRYGAVNVKQVDEALRLAYRMGFDLLIFAGFAFEPEARATLEKNPIPGVQVHLANMSPDIIVGDLLKAPKGSQLFTVFGEPDVLIIQKGDEYTVKLRGVDIYDPITGTVHQSEGKDIPAWFLDEDFDGLTFRISQAFFPKEATKKDPWDKLENALRGSIDKKRIEMFRGTESFPFKSGSENKVAVKVIDARGNEVMVVKTLKQSADC